MLFNTTPVLMRNGTIITNSLWASVDRGATWEKRNSNLTGIQLVSQVDTLYLAYLSSLLKSRDGGFNWDTILRYNGGTFQHLMADDAGHIFVTAYSNSIRRVVGYLFSTNSGATWQADTTNDTAAIISLYAYDGHGKLWASQHGHFVVSRNYGGTWQPQGGGARLPQVMDSSGVYYFAEADSVFRSIDSCSSWALATIVPHFWYGSIECVLSDQSLWLRGTDSAAWGDVRYRSTDRGYTWNKLPFSRGDYCQLLEVGDHLYMGMMNGMYISEDQGKTWQLRNESIFDYGVPYANLTYLSAGNDGQVLACDLNGVYATSNGGSTWHLENMYQDGVNGPKGSRVSGLFACPNGRVYAFSKPNLFLVDSDRTPWQRVPIDTGWFVTTFLALNDTDLFAQSGHRLYSTHNGGTSWSVELDSFYSQYPLYKTVDGSIIGSNVGPDSRSYFYRRPKAAIGWEKTPMPAVFSVFAANRFGIFAFLGDHIVHSSDEGMTWDSIYPPPDIKYPYVDQGVVDSLGGIILSTNSSVDRFIVMSTDNGQNWKPICDGLRTGNTPTYYDLSVDANNYLWIRSSREVYRTDAPLDHSLLGVSVRDSKATNHFSVSMRGRTLMISCDEPSAGSIDIYSVLGVCSLRREWHQGSKLDLGSLPAGIYFCVLNASNFPQFISLIVLE